MVFLFTRPNSGGSAMGLVGPWSMPRIVVFPKMRTQLGVPYSAVRETQIFEMTVLDD